MSYVFTFWDHVVVVTALVVVILIVLIDVRGK